jgi:hypothetical protein
MFTGRKLPLTLAFVVLVALAFGASCKGFFVDPVLTSITIGPTGQNVQMGDTLQMSARGSFDDGSTKNLTSSVLWSSDPSEVATISKGGLVSAKGPGVASVSATLDTISDSTDVNVVLTDVTAILIAPDKQSDIAKGTTTTFTCTAKRSGNPDVDITTTATWTSDDTTNITIDSTSSPAKVTPGTGTASGDHTITASYTVGSTTFTDTAILNVK